MAEAKLLDVGQAAVRLGVKVRWVRRAVAERRIPLVKMGHYVRFVPADLDAYVESCRIEPMPPRPLFLRPARDR